MEEKGKIYNEFNPAEPYTEIYNKNLTLSIWYQEGDKYTETITKCTDNRFMAELKVPGLGPIQRFYSTLDVLLLMHADGERSFEDSNPEDHISNYLTAIRKNIYRELPNILKVISSDANSFSGLSGMEWKFISPKGGNSFIVLKGDDSNLAAARLINEFEHQGVLAVHNGLVVALPHIDIHSASYSKILNCLSDKYEKNSFSRVIREDSRDITLEFSDSTAFITRYGNKYDATELIKGLKDMHVDLKHENDQFFKNILKHQKVSLGDGFEGVMVRSVWGYSLKTKLNCKDTLNELQIEP